MNSTSHRWPRHIGLLNDYLRISFANGSTFASRFLYRELEARGHRVTVIGPRDPSAREDELPPRRLALAALPLRSHPGVQIPMPTQRGLARLARSRFDLLLGQTSSALMCAGLWLRQRRAIPLVMVNTFHLPRVYETLLPQALLSSGAIQSLFRRQLLPWVQRQTAEAYNQSDGLVVLSPGLRDYWRAHGVQVPIHVIPRAIDTAFFAEPRGVDPFPTTAQRGSRLLVVCRHAREKSVDRLLDIFAAHIAPRAPQATLTLVGDGPEQGALKRRALARRIAHRTFFVGEQRQSELANWYANADLFVYTSLSETYGQVVTEALWNALPAVAFADDMGVSGQLAPGRDGELIAPGPQHELANERFAQAVLRLLENPARRRAYAKEARARARNRADARACIARYYEAFDIAHEHRIRTALAHPPNETDGIDQLARWASLHAMLATLGLLRPPATAHRARSRPPRWRTECTSHEKGFDDGSLARLVMPHTIRTGRYGCCSDMQRIVAQCSGR